MDNKAKARFYFEHKVGIELKKIFERDGYKYDVGTEDYIVRSVLEARAASINVERPNTQPFSDTTRLSRFDDLEAAIAWMSERGLEITQGIRTQVEELWRTCENHAAIPDQYPYLLDYEITVSAKRNKKPRVYFSKKMLRMGEDDLYCSEHQCPKNLVDYEDGSRYECPECQRERGEELGLE